MKNIYFFLLFFTFLQVVLTTFFENEYFVLNNYKLYLVQFIVNIFVLLKFIKPQLKLLFLPSLFSYIFLSINLILGGYLTPRNFGFYKVYTDILFNIENYHLINTYLLFSLEILFILSIIFIKKVEKIKFNNTIQYQKINIFISLVLTFCSFIFQLPFGFTLAFIIITLFKIRSFNILIRLIFNLSLIISSVIYYSFDKRNIAMVLFLIIFFEILKSSKIIKLNLKVISSFFLVFVLFISLIILASINRGYGKSLELDSNYVSNIINYSSSPIFMDAITDNLELNFNYGSTFTAMKYLDEGEINYQLGLTIIKPLLIFFPREYFPFKPYNFMHLYTMKHQYAAWKTGSSMPVIFPIELFGNFHFFGLLFLLVFYYYFNSLYFKFVRDFNNSIFNYKTFTCIFLISIHLILVRGSGLDLFVIYLLFGTASYFTVQFILKSISLKSN